MIFIFHANKYIKYELIQETTIVVISSHEFSFVAFCRKASLLKKLCVWNAATLCTVSPHHLTFCLKLEKDRKKKVRQFKSIFDLACCSRLIEVMDYFPSSSCLWNLHGASMVECFDVSVAAEKKRDFRGIKRLKQWATNECKACKTIRNW